MTQHPSITGAIIVLYFPEWEVLQELLESLRNQVSKIYLISNGMGDNIRDALKEFECCTIIVELSNNPGLGKALNVGVALAIDDQCEYVLLFDQDSMAPKNYLAVMLHELQNIPQDSKNWAAIGPSFYDVRSTVGRVNNFKKDGLRVLGTNDQGSIIPCDCLITSGMLLNLKKLQPFPKFDESFFVDQVDSEWCFRLNAKGYGLYGSRKVQLAHRLSDASAWHIGPLTFLRYSPLRRYWYYKNSVRLIRSPYTPTMWKLRLVGILTVSFIPNLFLDENAWLSAKMMLLGLWSGLNSPAQSY